MRLFKTAIFTITVALFSMLPLSVAGKSSTVSNSAELETAVVALSSGDEIVMLDGVYSDIKLVVRASGVKNDSIVIRAENPGKVKFSGNVKVELRGDYIVLRDIYFCDGQRDPRQWKTHGPGLVAIYGSHNRVSNCLFWRFDTAESAWVTTSIDEKERVPQYCRIDHCAFIEKTTYDQVINLNNTPTKSDTGEPGIAMYHRIDHCYFSNPKKQGNAGGGIRIGYWRKDFGRCLVDNNLFERQDSEPEIVTSKSMENIYLNNTILNCSGTLNFRHGDRQVAINNFFYGTDKKREYGGMFIWGSGHLVACNYFNLPTTIRSRGNAALYLNPGPEGSEHALTYDMTVAGNLFVNNNGCDIHFSPQVKRREEVFGENTKLPRDVRFIGNIFVGKEGKYTIFNDRYERYGDQQWRDNYYKGRSTGLKTEIPGLKEYPIKFRMADNRAYVEPSKGLNILPIEVNIKSFIGVDIDFAALVANGIVGKPLTRGDVGPTWCDEFPGTYADTCEWSEEVRRQFEEIKARGDRQ